MDQADYKKKVLCWMYWCTGRWDGKLEARPTNPQQGERASEGVGA